MIKYPGTKFYLNLSSPMIGDDVKLIQSRLATLGLLKQTDADGYFGVSTDKAVREYQRSVSLPIDGVVDSTTWDKLFNDVALLDSTVKSVAEMRQYDEEVGRNNKGSFFAVDRKQTLRKNGRDIVITFGNGHRRKTIQNVVYRGKSVVINAGGEPIAETYDFIAKDLIESEEE